MSSRPSPASSSAASITPSSASTWARAAISGTTPPKAAWSSIWLSTTLDRMRPAPSVSSATTEAAVSSQLVSMPSIRIMPRVQMEARVAGPRFPR
jgi:hypothetical protein